MARKRVGVPESRSQASGCSLSPTGGYLGEQCGDCREPPQEAGTEIEEIPQLLSSSCSLISPQASTNATWLEARYKEA